METHDSDVIEYADHDGDIGACSTRQEVGLTVDLVCVLIASSIVFFELHADFDRSDSGNTLHAHCAYGFMLWCMYCVSGELSSAATLAGAHR